MEFPNAKDTLDKEIQCSKHMLCMNAGMERAMNSENVGTRIMENGAPDQKYGLWRLSGAKQPF
jgi:hypothetical protein